MRLFKIEGIKISETPFNEIADDTVTVYQDSNMNDALLIAHEGSSQNHDAGFYNH